MCTFLVKQLFGNISTSSDNDAVPLGHSSQLRRQAVPLYSSRHDPTTATIRCRIASFHCSSSSAWHASARSCRHCDFVYSLGLDGEAAAAKPSGTLLRLMTPARSARRSARNLKHTPGSPCMSGARGPAGARTTKAQAISLWGQCQEKLNYTTKQNHDLQTEPKPTPAAFREEPLCFSRHYIPGSSIHEH